MSSDIPLPDLNSCLFLDVDGTLIDFTALPSSTRADAGLKNLLIRGSRRLNGALALVSGRTLCALDEIFDPLRLPAAGSHGGEMRIRADTDPDRVRFDPRLDAARAALSREANAWPGVMLEEKDIALAIHFRLNAAAAPRLTQLVNELLAQLGPDFQCLPGDHVLELKPKAFEKAEAIRRFMSIEPFRGRRPIFIGDDQSDLGGFAFVEGIGGETIAVGPRVKARWHLPDPNALREWLRNFNEAVAA